MRIRFAEIANESPWLSQRQLLFSVLYLSSAGSGEALEGCTRCAALFQLGKGLRSTQRLHQTHFTAKISASYVDSISLSGSSSCLQWQIITFPCLSVVLQCFSASRRGVCPASEPLSSNPMSGSEFGVGILGPEFFITRQSGSRPCSSSMPRSRSLVAPRVTLQLKKMKWLLTQKSQ